MRRSGDGASREVVEEVLQELAEETGRAIASELAALGFNLNFAPVLDVHTNPENPIIGDRSFGTTAEAATERALAFWRGLEALGCVRGCGKHFPGHGDTSTDSHHTLPVVHHSEARLRSVELVPFAAAIKAGIRGSGLSDPNHNQTRVRLTIKSAIKAGIRGSGRPAAGDRPTGAVCLVVWYDGTDGHARRNR